MVYSMLHFVFKYLISYVIWNVDKVWENRFVFEVDLFIVSVYVNLLFSLS